PLSMALLPNVWLRRRANSCVAPRRLLPALDFCPDCDLHIQLRDVVEHRRFDGSRGRALSVWHHVARILPAQSGGACHLSGAGAGALPLGSPQAAHRSQLSERGSESGRCSSPLSLCEWSRSTSRSGAEPPGLLGSWSSRCVDLLRQFGGDS